MIVANTKAQKRKAGVLNVYYQGYVEGFKTWFTRLGYAKSTVKSNSYKLIYFFKVLQAQQITTIYNIKAHHVTNYYNSLKCQKLSATYIRSCLLAIKNFNKYLQHTENYSLTFTPLTIEKQLANTREILTQGEVQTLFSSINNGTLDLRNKALLHLLYSCGLRSEEVSRVGVKDLDYHKHLLYVQPGKTRKGRYVPLHQKITEDFKTYEQYARPIINPKGNYFLVSQYTNNFNTQTISRILKALLEQTNITKNITPHCLRHSIATHLLAQGMPIENIRQFLGHQNLQTTQRYIRVTLSME